ncbi:restriction endonuclease [Microbacterium sp. NPDC056052]|uniref:restriction endonuclease n=1 Tax=Microbacterium sp. NPDC056052 TaxID=3345695 RepID=UPI0035DB4A2A
MGDEFVARYSANRVSDFLHAGRRAPSTTAQGRACEDLGEYLFGKFTGVDLVARDQLDAFGAMETDLIFTNNAVRSGLYFLEPVLIVECKNYANAKVSSEDVAYFASRLKSKGARSGVILTTTTVSGAQGHAGIHAMEVALAQGTTILLIDGTHLVGLDSTESLLATLMNQMVHFRTHGTLLR